MLLITIVAELVNVGTAVFCHVVATSSRPYFVRNSIIIVPLLPAWPFILCFGQLLMPPGPGFSNNAYVLLDSIKNALCFF
jgi:hypothetical protein